MSNNIFQPDPNPPTDPPEPGSGMPSEPDAVELIRDKVARLYSAEPDARAEIAEAYALPKPRSVHQQYMYDLSTSGKDLATIQTDWHNYYSNLSDQEKHQVWREFYDSQSLVTGQKPKLAKQADANLALSEHKQAAARPNRRPPAIRDSRSRSQIQAAIRDKVTAGGKLSTKHHLQSLAFGLSMGCLVVFIFLFGFFNQVFIAPFIQPSRASASTPIILSTDSVAPTPNPEVIIPKINVEIPVNYNETSTDENTIENDLQDGVVHYPTTVLPGQNGNTAFFGHSSNNIFNQGKYKFAFVLLHDLVPGDTFYLTYNDKVYVYKVISKTIVDPSDVGVLGPVAGQTATATLITCDPPGTSLHRLIVVGTQISPNPTSNSTPSTPIASSSPKLLPSDGQTLWSKFIHSIIGQLIILAILISLGWLGTRRFIKRRITS